VIGDARARHLVLIGLMGAGKTTVGRRCAVLLDRPFVDTDDVIEAQIGLPFTEWFATYGEAAFRDLERQAVADVAASPAPLVIACGGGSVVDPDNRRALRASGTVVWLRGSVQVLAARVGDGATRPLLAGDPVGALTRLGAMREAAYEAAADEQIDTDGRDVDAVAIDVLDAFRAREAARS
jgi:shikimate kinase